MGGIMDTENAVHSLTQSSPLMRGQVSAPVRNIPDPITRWELLRLRVIAYGFAGTFNIQELSRCFSGAKIRRIKAQIVAEFGPYSFCVAFDFGAVVFINVDTENRKQVISSVMSHFGKDEPHPPLEQEFKILVDPRSPPQGLVQFDRVVVPGLSASILELVARLLAQSVCLDYYEEDLQEILAKADKSVEIMKSKGRLSASPRRLIRYLGSALETKKQILSALSLLDKPSLTEKSEALDCLYAELRRNLEIDERYRSLDQKLHSIQEGIKLFLELSQGRRMLFLEITIVALIFFEIAVTLFQR
jgi:uncharacterized Rmd1/YagE family protein